MENNERRTRPRNYSEDFMEFFSFKHRPDPDSRLSFGYSKDVASYFLLKRQAYPDEKDTKPGYVPLRKVKFGRYDRVLRSLLATVRELYGLDDRSRIRINKVEQQMLCTTNPFKISATVDGKDKAFYLKEPSVKRAIGKAFYNLIVPDRFLVYKFNEHGLAVDHVPGKEIEDDERRDLIRQRPFVEELVRLNVFTNLMQLDDILQETNANCSYSKSKGIYLFDFDRCFTDGDYKVLSRFKEIRSKVHIKSVDEDERYKIFRNLRAKASKIDDLLKVVSQDLPEIDLAYYRGADDLGELLRREFNKLGNWQH